MMLSGRKILVTGGAGFIGSHLTERLLDQENTVVVYDNFDDYYAGKMDNLKSAIKNSRFKLVRGDILDYEKISAVIADSDVVFHLAAQPGVRFSALNPWKTNRVNVDGTLNVLWASKAANVQKIVVASSSSVYGVPQYLPCDEKHPTLPISVYGTSKLASEDYCNTFFRTFRLPVTILRYHTVYGPRQRPDMAIRKFADMLYRGEAPTIFGDGNQTRDFTYVADAIEGTILAAENENSSGETFNVGSGTQISVNHMIKLLMQLANRSDGQLAHAPEQVGDVPETHADILKARKYLGYNPRWNFNQGLEAFLEWYTKNCLNKDE